MKLEFNLESRLNIYVACDFVNTSWTYDELETVIDMWNLGYSIEDISFEANHLVEEIGLLIIDLSKKRGLFNKRKRGLKSSPPINLTAYYSNIKKRFLNANKNGYEVFSDGTVDFIWDEKQVIRFDNLWNSGFSFGHIKNHLNRPEKDIWMLIVDRTTKGRIYPRKGGLEGWYQDAFVQDCEQSRRFENIS